MTQGSLLQYVVGLLEFWFSGLLGNSWIAGNRALHACWGGQLCRHLPGPPCGHSLPTAGPQGEAPPGVSAGSVGPQPLFCGWRCGSTCLQGSRTARLAPCDSAHMLRTCCQAVSCPWLLTPTHHVKSSSQQTCCATPHRERDATRGNLRKPDITWQNLMEPEGTWCNSREPMWPSCAACGVDMHMPRGHSDKGRPRPGTKPPGMEGCQQGASGSAPYLLAWRGLLLSRALHVLLGFKFRHKPTDPAAY